MKAALNAVEGQRVREVLHEGRLPERRQRRKS